jgi:hypothetical protein
MTDIDQPDDLAAAVQDWTARAQAHERLVAQLFPANKKAIFAALAAAGVSSVTVTFDGYGDSGQIESIQAIAAEAPVDLPPDEIAFAVAQCDRTEPESRPATVADAIEQLVYDLLARTHGGWELNEGSWGEFVFHVAIETITLDFQQRYVSCDSFSHEF